MPSTPTSNYDRTSRLKPREGDGIGWSSLLQRFREVQDKATRAKSLHAQLEDRPATMGSLLEPPMESDRLMPETPKFMLGQPPPARSSNPDGVSSMPRHEPKHKSRSGFSNLGRLARVGQKGKQ